MQKTMIMEIRSYMEAYKMLRPGDRVIAAVSGGADSVCLLWALQKIAPEFPAFLVCGSRTSWTAGDRG